jgi:hypothetical protein
VPHSASELIGRVEAAANARSEHSDPIGRGRCLFLLHVRDLVSRYGLPLPEKSKLDACAMPFIFQELIYDGYTWSDRLGDYGHLADIVEIDVIVWSGGRDRTELTDQEFEAYGHFVSKAIDYRSPH